jgi:GTPase Era involved in 16S rRNA processing
MSWDDVRLRQILNLERSLTTLDRAIQLAQEVRVDISPDLFERLEKVRQKADRQLKRLHENRFEVAILGLEKAGKSSLMNAWLGEEIAPHADERCSYTTLELRPAATEEEQEFRVDYFTAAEFSEQVREKEASKAGLPESSSDFKTVNQELTEIYQLRSEIDRYIRQGHTTRKFRLFSEIREDVFSAVAKDKARARAAKRVTLRTTAMSFSRDVVFFDVPGFDSPVTLHREKAIEQARAVDAMIIAAKLDTPSPNNATVQIMKVAESEDSHVSLADKAFLALTRSDTTENARLLQERVDSHRKYWDAVAADRFVPVSSMARFADSVNCEPRTREIAKEARERLQKLGIDDGIDKLKDVVKNYIDHDRSRILERRCTGLASDAANLVDELFATLRPLYADDVAALEASSNESAEQKFNKWWTQEWQHIQSGYEKFHDEKIRCKTDVDGERALHPSFQALKEAYETNVDAELSDSVLLEREALKSKYQRELTGPGGVQQPGLAHSMIRRELHVDVMRGISSVARSLSVALNQLSNDMLDEMQRLLRLGKDVRVEMGAESSESKIRDYELGLSTLFLRWSRVAANLLVSVPQSDRGRAMGQFERDVLALGHFDPRTQTAQNITKGSGEENFEKAKSLLEIAELMGIVPPGTTKVVERAKPTIFGKPVAKPTPINGSRADDFDAVYQEIAQDLKSLRQLLKSAVFDAAGFIAYCDQELETIRGTFRRLENNEGRWHAKVKTAVWRRDPNIPFKLENLTADLERRKRVADLMTQLRAARMGTN